MFKLLTLKKQNHLLKIPFINFLSFSYSLSGDCIRFFKIHDEFPSEKMTKFSNSNVSICLSSQLSYIKPVSYTHLTLPTNREV